MDSVATLRHQLVVHRAITENLLDDFRRRPKLLPNIATGGGRLLDVLDAVPHEPGCPSGLCRCLVLRWQVPVVRRLLDLVSPDLVVVGA